MKLSTLGLDTAQSPTAESVRLERLFWTYPVTIDNYISLLTTLSTQHSVEPLLGKDVLEHYEAIATLC